MIATKYISTEDFEDTLIYYAKPTDALKRPDIRALNDALAEKCEQEATKLYRLARKMSAKGCSPQNVQKCREEANALHMNNFPWQILNPFTVWSYAFQY